MNYDTREVVVGSGLNIMGFVVLIVSAATSQVIAVIHGDIFQSIPTVIVLTLGAFYFVFRQVKLLAPEKATADEQHSAN